MVKKIGIITFHNADNYGAILQAYATQEFLISNHFDAYIIDYFHNNSSASRPLFSKVLSSLKAMLKSDTRRVFLKHLKCNRFRKKYLIKTKKYHGDNSIKQDPPMMDVFISGSDQILNYDLTHDSDAFYLSFVKQGKKISYASSFGKSSLNTKEIMSLTNYLSSFNAVSFREKDGYLLASNYILGLKESIVLDPVFLLDLRKWEKLLPSAKRKLPNMFIFVYGVENNELFIDVVQTLSKKYDLPIYGAFSSSFKCPPFVKNVSNSNPTDFLFFISNATFVVTNSFHGTAFSIIFKKKFVCIDPLVRRSRIVEILQKTGNLSKLISSLPPQNQIENLMIDGDEAYSALYTEIQYSQHYLLGAILND